MFNLNNKRDFGNKFESFAREKIEQAGCRIIATNYACKLGEIDIIAKDKEHIIFVEVRYRKTAAYGGAIASVDYKKQQKIIKSASLYLQQNKLTNKAMCRFDVFAVTGQTNNLHFEWIKDAFNA